MSEIDDLLSEPDEAVRELIEDAKRKIRQCFGNSKAYPARLRPAPQSQDGTQHE